MNTADKVKEAIKKYKIDEELKNILPIGAYEILLLSFLQRNS